MSDRERALDLEAIERRVEQARHQVVTMSGASLPLSTAQGTVILSAFTKTSALIAEVRRLREELPHFAGWRSKLEAERDQLRAALKRIYDANGRNCAECNLRAEHCECAIALPSPPSSDREPGGEK